MRKPVILTLKAQNILKAECTFRVVQNPEVGAGILSDKALMIKHKGTTYMVTGGEGFPVSEESRQPMWANKRFLSFEAKKYVKMLEDSFTVYGEPNGI